MIHVYIKLVWNTVTFYHVLDNNIDFGSLPFEIIIKINRFV